MVWFVVLRFWVVDDLFAGFGVWLKVCGLCALRGVEVCRDDVLVSLLCRGWRAVLRRKDLEV